MRLVRHLQCRAHIGRRGKTPGTVHFHGTQNHTFHIWRNPRIGGAWSIKGSGIGSAPRH